MELKVDLKDRSYQIIIEKGLINRVSEEISRVYKGKELLKGFGSSFFVSANRRGER